MSILSDYKSRAANNKPLGKLHRLVKELKEVLEDEDLDWEEKYDLVFATHQQDVKALLVETRLHLDYYDPDTSCEEDARAYVTALEDLVGLK